MAEQDLKEGHIRCSTIIEVLGKPKEHVEKTIRDYVAKIKKDENFMIMSEKYSDVKPQDVFFSIFVELEMIAKGMDALIGFCLDYMPSSVEIIKPESFIIKNNTLSGLINDMQAKLHTVDMIVKQQRTEVDFLKINLKRSLKNSITLILKMKERGHSELSRLTGIDEKNLKTFLDQMIVEKEVKKEGELYYPTK